MATISIGDPASVVVEAVAQVVSAVFGYASTVRSTMSEAAKDEQDHITAQAYWDFRAVLQAIGVVGEKIPWPNVVEPGKVNPVASAADVVLKR